MHLHSPITTIAIFGQVSPSGVTWIPAASWESSRHVYLLRIHVIEPVVDQRARIETSSRRESRTPSSRYPVM